MRRHGFLARRHQAEAPPTQAEGGRAGRRRRNRSRARCHSIGTHDLIWFKNGCALATELGDAGFELFDPWSATSFKYNADQCAAKWRECMKVNFHVFLRLRFRPLTKNEQAAAPYAKYADMVKQVTKASPLRRSRV